MHPAIESFLERPTSHKAGFWIGSLFLVLAGYWYLFYSGQAEIRDNVNEEVEELRTEIMNETRLAQQLPKVKRQVEELNLRLKFALQELPDKREIPDLLSSVSNLARDAGLEVNLFAPKGEKLKDFYAEVPVEIAVTGAYHQVATFFDEVGQLNRIVNIRLTEMADPKIKPDFVRVSTKCTATTFRYLDEEERAAQKAKKKGKKGRRRR